MILKLAYFHCLHEWPNIQCQFRTIFVITAIVKHTTYMRGVYYNIIVDWKDPSPSLFEIQEYYYNIIAI